MFAKTTWPKYSEAYIFHEHCDDSEDCHTGQPKPSMSAAEPLLNSDLMGFYGDSMGY